MFCVTVSVPVDTTPVVAGFAKVTQLLDTLIVYVPADTPIMV
jgi:hypothetical protein